MRSRTAFTVATSDAWALISGVRMRSPGSSPPTKYATLPSTGRHSTSTVGAKAATASGSDVSTPRASACQVMMR